MCQEHNPTDGKRDVAKPVFVLLAVRADKLARRFGILLDSHRQQSDRLLLLVHVLDRSFGKPVPLPERILAS